ncbi:hypothetical protein FQA47_024383 [Oryzias melastigma]|uniref:Uncharacterized protein n=1 Tax=Oryzias melastigma TaxID=30732 RepID=A0A834FBK0_ORYME|nr:hypothetical protein FQA47_024383 [Oryzias melastigma]
MHVRLPTKSRGLHKTLSSSGFHFYMHDFLFTPNNCPLQKLFDDIRDDRQSRAIIFGSWCTNSHLHLSSGRKKNVVIDFQPPVDGVHFRLV